MGKRRLWWGLLGQPPLLGRVSPFSHTWEALHFTFILLRELVAKVRGWGAGEMEVLN